MDTGTHLVMGLSLAGLAHLDPQLGQHSALPTAVLLGTVIGSQAPDADYLMQLRSYARYIENHRGFSHSVIAWMGWALVISLCTVGVFHVSWWPVFFWTLLAVIIHVLTDMCNYYGTLGFWPFSRHWFRWGFIPLTDPFIITTHLLGLVLWWIWQYPPGVIFGAVYLMTFVYFLYRLSLRQHIVQKIKKAWFHPDHPPDFIVTIPTVTWRSWQWVAKREDQILTGDVLGRTLKLKLVQHTDLTPLPDVVGVAMRCEDVRRFFAHSRQFLLHEVRMIPTQGYEVTFQDIRYRKGTRFTYGAKVWLNLEMEVLDIHLGWLESVRSPFLEEDL